MYVPSNLIALATHGTHEIPEFVEEKVALEDGLRKAYSDFSTASLLDYIPEPQKSCPRYGRLIGDPNRAPDAPDLVRDHDFKGNPIWKEALTEAEKEDLLHLSYIPYHNRVLELLSSEYGDEDLELLVIDLHDYPFRLQEEEGLPPVIISNGDGLTASDEVMQSLVDGFVQHMGLSPSEVLPNAFYKGGYVTRFYGDPENDALRLAPHKRHVVQIELSRSFYMDEKTQELDPIAVELIREQLTKIFVEAAHKLASKNNK